MTTTYEMDTLANLETGTTYDKTFTSWSIFKLNIQVIDQYMVINKKTSLCNSYTNMNEITLKLDSIVGFDYDKSNDLTKCLLLVFSTIFSLCGFCTFLFDNESTLDFLTILVVFVMTCVSIVISSVITQLVLKKKFHIITMNKIYTYNANIISHDEILKLWNVITNQKNNLIQG